MEVEKNIFFARMVRCFLLYGKLMRKFTLNIFSSVEIIKLTGMSICSISIFFFDAAISDNLSVDCEGKSSYRDKVNCNEQQYYNGYSFFLENDVIDWNSTFGLDKKNEDRHYTQGTTVEYFGKRIINDTPFLISH